MSKASEIEQKIASYPSVSEDAMTAFDPDNVKDWIKRTEEKEAVYKQGIAEAEALSAHDQFILAYDYYSLILERMENDYLLGASYSAANKKFGSGKELAKRLKTAWFNCRDERKIAKKNAGIKKRK